jgi:hypothetical protein
MDGMEKEREKRKKRGKEKKRGREGEVDPQCKRWRRP